MADFADATYSVPVQIQQGGTVLALGNGATLAADAAAVVNLGNVTAGNLTMPTGGIKTAAIAAGNVTPAKMAVTGIKSASFNGAASASNITVTGLAVGDRVLAIFQLSASQAATGNEASFESVITTADVLKQTSSTNLSGIRFGLLTLPAAT